MGGTKVKMESLESRWKVRPEAANWNLYRLIDISKEPGSEGDFIPWPINQEGEREHVVLADKMVMELKNGDGSMGFYAHGSLAFRLAYGFRAKGKYMVYEINIEELPFKVHPRRIWLEDKEGFRYFSGKIVKGKVVYIVEGVEEYRLGIDEACRALLTSLTEYK